MQNIIISTIYLILLVYAVMAAFISVRDIITTKHKTLWISIIALLVGVFVFLFFTRSFNLLAFPIALFVSVPIFVTDKRRDWDGVDRIFRWVNIVTLLVLLFLFFNSYSR